MKTLFTSARSIRYAGIVIMMSAASAMQACSTETIVAPAQAVTKPPVSKVAQLRVSGTVTNDDGAPVSGVIVRIYRWTSTRELVSAVVSDDKGFYSMSFLSAVGISAFTEKAGYLSVWQDHRIERQADFQWDLRIHRTP